MNTNLKGTRGKNKLVIRIEGDFCVLVEEREINHEGDINNGARSERDVWN